MRRATGRFLSASSMYAGRFFGRSRRPAGGAERRPGGALAIPAGLRRPLAVVRAEPVSPFVERFDAQGFHHGIAWFMGRNAADRVQPCASRR